MNTFPKYLKEIRYRKARCCHYCKHFIDDKTNKITYCRLHDNPVSRTYICKFWNKGIIKDTK